MGVLVRVGVQVALGVQVTVGEFVWVGVNNNAVAVIPKVSVSFARTVLVALYSGVVE